MIQPPNPKPEIRSFALPNVAATLALGDRLGALLTIGDVAALWGDLGSGKTTLTRGLVQGRLGPDAETPSPTFTLVQTYDLPAGELWHFDLYRLESAEDAFELGIEDAFADAISIIEWPGRLGQYLPSERLDVVLSIQGDARTAKLYGGEYWARRLQERRL